MKHNLIAGIVIILLVAGFAIFNIVTDKKPVEYFLVTGFSSYDNSLIEDHRTFKNMVKKNGLKETMSNSITFEKENVLEYFNEEYFQNKKIAAVVVYEDNSKDYMYGITDVTYNEDKTEATITYYYKVGTFADTFANIWHNYMFVEMDSTVKDVKFVLDNSNIK